MYKASREGNEALTGRCRYLGKSSRPSRLRVSFRRGIRIGSHAKAVKPWREVDGLTSGWLPQNIGEILGPEFLLGKAQLTADW